MNISVIITSLEIGPPYIGSLAGVRRYSYSLVQNLAKNNINVHVISTNKPSSDDDLINCQNVHFYIVPSRKEQRDFVRKRGGTIKRDSKYFSKQALKKYYEITSKNKISIIQTVGFSAYYFLKEKKKGKISTPIIASFSDTDDNSIPSLKMLKFADHIFCPFTSVKKEVVKKAELLQKRISVISSSIDGMRYSQYPKLEDIENFKNKYDISTSHPLLLLLGPFTSKRDHLELVKLFPTIVKNLPDINFLIIGDGPNLSKIKEEIVKFELEERVTITGYIPDNELLIAYHISDVLLSSTKRGTSATPIIEAMASGLPIIALQIPPYNEILPIDYNYLYPIEKKEKAIELLLSLLGEKANIKKLEMELKEHSLKNYNHSVVGRNIIKIYKSILGSNE